jgi:hypothetical protein
VVILHMFNTFPPPGIQKHELVTVLIEMVVQRAS